MAWRRMRVNRSLKSKCHTCTTPGVLVIHCRNRNGEHGVFTACEVCDGPWLPCSAAVVTPPTSRQK